MDKNSANHNKTRNVEKDQGAEWVLPVWRVLLEAPIEWCHAVFCYDKPVPHGDPV